jgi:hypothetical protein
MTHAWLVFKGWMNPDSSPSLYGVFSSLELAQEFSGELREADCVRHMTNYGEQKGSIEWINRTVRNVIYDNSEITLPDSWAEYWESHTSFGGDCEDRDHRMIDDVIYIQKVEIDAKDLCDRS